MDYIFISSDQVKPKEKANWFYFSIIALFIIGMLLEYFIFANPCKYSIKLIFILIGTSVFHFILEKPISALRLKVFKKKEETVIEHFLLFFISLMLFIILDVFYYGIHFTFNYFALNMLYFLIVCEILYLSEYFAFKTLNEFDLVVDIGSYIVYLIYCEFIIYYLRYFTLVPVLLLLLPCIYIFQRFSFYD